MWTIDNVKQLVAEGRFHHATARTIGVSRIWIYARNASGFRGYELVASIDDTPDAWAYFRSIGHGVSVGARGEG